MGWKSTVRGVNASMKRAAKESERRNREHEKFIQAQKASAAVEEWRNYLEYLQGLHIVDLVKIDWWAIANTPQPEQPRFLPNNEKSAREKLQEFENKKGGLFFRKSDKKRKKFLLALEEAKHKDQDEFARKEGEYESELSDWKSETSFAERIIANEPYAIAEVINESQTLSEEGVIGSSFELTVKDGIIRVILNVHGQEIVPKSKYRQLASGRLSESKMPKGEFNELYQDYVVSAALRVAVELLNLTYVESILVNCKTEMLNSATGHVEPQTILSVLVMRQTVENLNLENIDPSDSLSNFIHKINFSRAKGFLPVQEVELDAVEV